jgi:hypothetical protein
MTLKNFNYCNCMIELKVKQLKWPTKHWEYWSMAKLQNIKVQFWLNLKQQIVVWYEDYKWLQLDCCKMVVFKCWSSISLLSIANCSIDNILEIMAPRVDSNSWQDTRWAHGCIGTQHLPWVAYSLALQDRYPVVRTQ